MDNVTRAFFAVLFPLLFIAGWLTITTVLMTLAGWFDLARKYPDRADPALCKLRFQSGRMGSFLGGVSMSGILRLETCQTGLRVGLARLFGPFCRDFFVPWDEIRVKRGNRLIWKVANLEFGHRGNLELFDYTANRLARSVPRQWPESGSFAKETPAQAAWGAFQIWLLLTTCAALFFSLVPRLMVPNGDAYPPLEMAIGFPALVFGISALLIFFRRIRD